MTTTSAKAAALEGLDFIETEEDVKAVEAATLKIQSTFRGKKFRSKLGAGKAEPEAPVAAEAPNQQQQQQQQQRPPTAAPQASRQQVNSSAGQVEAPSGEELPTSRKQSTGAAELNARLADMQMRASEQGGESAPAAGRQVGQQAAREEEEAERAATKIQAGFKGYRTRKELEVGGKLAASSAAGQQAAPDGQQK